MNGIGSFLEKFKRLLGNDVFLREAVAQAIFNLFKIKIEPKDVIVKDGTAVIKAHPVFKNEIFLKKNQILEELKKNGVSGIRNIK